jgi:hypothetical protein
MTPCAPNSRQWYTIKCMKVKLMSVDAKCPPTVAKRPDSINVLTSAGRLEVSPADEVSGSIQTMRAVDSNKRI